MCESKLEWTVEASTKDWIDAGVEWAAIDAATARDNVKHLKLETSLDGKTLTNTMKCPSSAEAFWINGNGHPAHGGGIKYALFLPPLSKGQHKIVWRASLDADISDGWNHYPKGTEMVFTATVTVK